MVKKKVKCHGKEINGFSTEEEAKSSCDYMKKQFKKDFYVYYCQDCKLYHVSPKDRQTRSFQSQCLDSSGNPKQSYLTEKEAITRKDIIFKEQKKKLFVYKCDKCNYFHLTHKDYKNENKDIYNKNENNIQIQNEDKKDKKCCIF